MTAFFDLDQAVNKMWPSWYGHCVIWVSFPDTLLNKIRGKYIFI